MSGAQPAEAPPPCGYTTAALVWTEVKVSELDELTCALWIAVDAATDKLADHAIEASSLRALARTISSEVGELLSNIRRMKAGGIGWHTPHREEADEAEAARTDDTEGEEITSAD